MIEYDYSDFKKLKTVALGAARVPTEVRSGTEANSRAGRFRIEPQDLNEIEKAGDTAHTKHVFPGNISPEGYFYCPFSEVTLKELTDEPSYVEARRINFSPDTASLAVTTVDVYNPDLGTTSREDIPVITLTSPVDYGFMVGRPFCVYDILEDRTYRGHMSAFTGNVISVALPSDVAIDEPGLKGLAEGADGKSRYIVSMLEDNAPDYAEFLPSSQRLVWRAPKKMSDLDSESPIYNMPFTNGRLYIHKNVNVFVRRQDPANLFHLFRPNPLNPLRRFQVEGEKPLDFDAIRYITDIALDAC